jgi:hypothetical protein
MRQGAEVLAIKVWPLQSISVGLDILWLTALLAGSFLFAGCMSRTADVGDPVIAVRCSLKVCIPGDSP